MYRSLVGVLNYISNSSRSDCCSAVSFHSKSLQDPTVADYKTPRRCLVHMRDVKEKSLVYTGKPFRAVDIKTFVDASFANGNNCRSICNCIILVTQPGGSFQLQTSRDCGYIHNRGRIYHPGYGCSTITADSELTSEIRTRDYQLYHVL